MALLQQFRSDIRPDEVATATVVWAVAVLAPGATRPPARPEWHSVDVAGEDEENDVLRPFEKLAETGRPMGTFGAGVWRSAERTAPRPAGGSSTTGRTRRTRDRSGDGKGAVVRRWAVRNGITTDSGEAPTKLGRIQGELIAKFDLTDAGKLFRHDPEAYLAAEKAGTPPAAPAATLAKAPAKAAKVPAASFAAAGGAGKPS